MTLCFIQRDSYLNSCHLFRSSSSKPCPNYVGVTDMNSVSSFQSILGQILVQVELLHIYPSQFSSMSPSAYLIFFEEPSTCIESLSPAPWLGCVGHVYTISNKSLLIYHQLILPLNAPKCTHYNSIFASLTKHPSQHSHLYYTLCFRNNLKTWVAHRGGHAGWRELLQDQPTQLMG